MAYIRMLFLQLGFVCVISDNYETVLLAGSLHFVNCLRTSVDGTHFTGVNDRICLSGTLEQPSWLAEACKVLLLAPQCLSL